MDLKELGGLALNVATAVLPLAVLFGFFQVLFLKLPRREVSRILRGTLLASVGLFLFLIGVGIGFLPFGKALGEAVGALPHKELLLPFGMLLGFVTAWGEPSVRVLADQVEEASSGSIPGRLVIRAICVGVSLAVGVGMLRIGFDIPLVYLLLPGYGVFLLQIAFADRNFVSIGIDAGGAATGPLANSFILAIALGAASAAGASDPLSQGLGLVALIALAPLLSVLSLGLLVRWKTRGINPGAPP
jgi:hypothetical protein